MNTTGKAKAGQKEKLINELMNLPPFRMGSITTRFRRCGKPTCACQQEGHPGHGPQSILTYKEGGKTKTHNLPTATAVEIAQQQIQARHLFKQWEEKWLSLNKKECDQQLEETLQAENNTTDKKKF